MLWFWEAIAHILAALTVSRFTWLAVLAARKRWEDMYSQRRPLWLLIGLFATVMLGRLTLLDAPLLRAARSGNVNVARILLACGADPNFKHKATPLHYAADGGHIEVVELLMARGADPYRQGELGHRLYRYSCTPYDMARHEWQAFGRRGLLDRMTAASLSEYAD
jgi:ankyrin repeat protein